MWALGTFSVVLLIAGSLANPRIEHSAKSTCGYESCTKPIEGMLNVHLVPHTHDDVGWLKTVDQYYYGSRTEIQKAGVQYILDSVIQELVHDPKKKFIYVETSFLWKWWMQQHDVIKHRVRQLVNSGQLEIISGGWSMNDEAVTHYQSTIDQMTWGFRKLNDTFGTCGRPHVGWQIDPFGHSREQASLFAQMGFDGLFIGRLDYQDKNQRLATKNAEMVWEGSPDNLGSKSSLFTHALFNGYSPPPGFCFDVLCEDDPIVESKKSPLYNVPTKVELFLKDAKEQAKNYATNNIMWTMGEDFNYQDAHMYFKNMDLLIHHVNAAQVNGSKVNVFYSTPSCYLEAVHNANRTWGVKTDDFFPYASGPHTYWTGYFTSKPSIKRFERLGNNFLQVCKQLYAISDLGPEDMTDLNRMREAMAILQHHDAITGTEKDHVAKDYARILTEAFGECGFTTKVALNKLMAKKAAAPMVDVDSCLLLNISSCALTESAHNFVVTVYNPLGHVISHHVRVPVTGSSYAVKDPKGVDQVVQLVPIHESVVAVAGRKSLASHEIVFHAVNVPPLGFRSYYVSKSNKINRDDIDSVEDATSSGFLGDQDLGVTLNDHGEAIGISVDGIQIPMKQTFGFYRGMAGDNKQSTHRASGAYIFRPNGTHPEPAGIVTSKVYKGVLVDEVHQTFSSGWISQVIRVYKADNHAEFEWMVGPIPEGNNEGKEVITRFTTPLKTNSTFYTDSNGREMLKRVRDFRPTWQLKSDESVSANYYPVTSKILLRDEDNNLEIAVLPDRAQGGTSLNDGEIELMVHRRLFFDDGFGVSEALDEEQFGQGLVARGKHYVIGGPISGQKPSLAAQERGLALRKHLAPWTFLTSADDITFDQWAASYNMEFSGLTKDLPKNVHLLTLEPWKAKSFLVRLEHFMEKTEDSILSKPATVNLQNLFTQFSIESARETTLGGNQWIEDADRFQWRKETNDVYDENEEQVKTPLDFKNVDLSPMQIRTFIVEIGNVKKSPLDGVFKRR